MYSWPFTYLNVLIIIDSIDGIEFAFNCDKLKIRSLTTISFCLHNQ